MPSRSAEVSGSGYCIASLGAALWAFLSTTDFQSAIVRAVNLGDDADTTAAICGQLAGAYYGVDSIPHAWRTRLAMADYIDLPSGIGRWLIVVEDIRSHLPA